MTMKSKIACEFNCELVSDPHLWSFTFPEGTPDAFVTSCMWRFWFKGMRNLMWGVRVWERQKNGTLHCHAVVSGFWQVEFVRGMFWKYAGESGRVNVQAVEDKDGLHYVAKYLGKQDATMKGRRRWSCFGRWPRARSKVKNLVHNGGLSGVYRGVTPEEECCWKPQYICLKDQRMRNWNKLAIARAKQMAGVGWLLYLRERRSYAGKEHDPFRPPLGDAGLDDQDMMSANPQVVNGVPF